MRLLLLLITLIVNGTPLFAQEIHSYEGLKNLPPSLQFIRVRREQRNNFIHLTDSIFMIGNYHRLIEICKDSIDNNYVKDLAQYNLIGAYYKIGKLDSSKAIISAIEKKSGHDYFEIGQLFSSNNFSLVSYLDITKNRTSIEDYIISHYRKEKYSKVKDGIILIKFLDKDQWIRRGNFLNKRQLSFIKWPVRKFRKANRKQGKALYELLKKNEGIYTKKEIGGYLFDMQFLLMAHDDNKKHRKLYLYYVKRAASEGNCLKKRILDFILRTEVLNMGWPKFKKIEKERTVQLKAEYNIPGDYYFGAY